MGHEQPAGKKTDNGPKRGQLQVRKPADGMAGGAAAGIAGTKADQESTAQQDQKTFAGQCRLPAENS